jgi:hypothetical protein
MAGALLGVADVAQIVAFVYYKISATTETSPDCR